MAYEKEGITVSNCGDGDLASAFNECISKVIDDIAEKPYSLDTRKVTLFIEVTPDKGGCYEILVSSKVTVPTIKRKSIAKISDDGQLQQLIDNQQNLPEMDGKVTDIKTKKEGVGK